MVEKKARIIDGMLVHSCPLCKKRVFDTGFDDKAKIRLKCPHCSKTITVSIRTRAGPELSKYIAK